MALTLSFAELAIVSIDARVLICLREKEQNASLGSLLDEENKVRR